MRIILSALLLVSLLLFIPILDVAGNQENNQLKFPKDSRLFSNSYEWIGDTISFREMLFFSADDGVNGIELWKSDGTGEGTVMIKDINEDGSSQPTYLTVLGN
ncbi:MAG TPA: hypothetical protein EYN30_06795, partial [Candidatus Poseidoniales archaeon]|nr:hypothetical protein [Candidatus Poseidoniales archaeon]